MSWLKCSTSWCVRKQILQQCRQTFWLQQLMQSYCSSSEQWTSANVRETFFKYFRDRDHQYVHSSSVLSHKDDGTYFVNAGMNQFKPIFLGTVDPDSEMAKYRRVVNSQKCIRISGKHNDLDGVGQDTYHHTFFEMLGTWSFGDYFKHEACEMALKLLTEVYKLPKERLYMTYFSGMKLGDLTIEPDLECKGIWLNLGIQSDHILPFVADNFWDMGDTGPCGHCTEIHYDQSPLGNSGHLVNKGFSDVVELCNLVFMVYDRQADDRLLSLADKHVDTGMGLERLTAVLQKKHSNYDTDLFGPLLKVIQQNTKCRPYQGLFGEDDVDGIDKAYRVIADHTRMITVAISDGVMPGKQKSESKLRLIIDNCLYQSIQILKQPPGSISQLVPVVVDILGGAFPELNHSVSKVMTVVNDSEQRYLDLLQKATKIMSKLKKSGTKKLSGAVLKDLQEGSNNKTRIPLNISLVVAARMNMSTEVDEYNKIMEEQMTRKPLDKSEDLDEENMFLKDLLASATDVTLLRQKCVPPTQDHYKYNQVWDDHTGCASMENLVPAIVLEIKSKDLFCDDMFTAKEGDFCTIILDSTPFYAEGGGQICDSGHWKNKNCTFNVMAVKERGGYVFHFGQVDSGSLMKGQTLHPSVDMTKRQQCAVNHTATHLLSYALQQVASDVMQQGSRITPDELVFDFSCFDSQLSQQCPQTVTSIVTELINNQLEVHTGTMHLKQAKSVPGLRSLVTEAYPSMSHVVSVGVPINELLTKSNEAKIQSVELCGGCHVDNLKRIGQFVILHFDGLSAQGTKRVRAVTGEAAQHVIENAKNVQSLLDCLAEDIRKGQGSETWASQLKHVEKLLFNEDDHDLPKIERDAFIRKTDYLKKEYVNKTKNKINQGKLEKEVELLTYGNEFEEYIVAELRRPNTVKKIAAALSSCAPVKPIMLFCGVSQDRVKRLKEQRPEHIAKVATGGIAIAYIPSQFTKKYSPEKKATAEGWIQYLDALSHNKRITINSVRKENNNTEKENHEMHFMTMYLDKEHSLQYYIHMAKCYMETLTVISGNNKD